MKTLYFYGFQENLLEIDIDSQYRLIDTMHTDIGALV